LQGLCNDIALCNIADCHLTGEYRPKETIFLMCFEQAEYVHAAVVRNISNLVDIGEN